MDNSAQWTQEVGVAKSNMGAEMGGAGTRKVRPQKEQVINCPRCHSTNTKFCYYNNYSLTQPRYFCKTCRRYWTEGGTLRNVPVGGGSRKNKRYATTTPPPPPHKHLPDLNPPQNQGHDLNLGFQDYHQHHHHHQSGPPQFLEFPKIESRVDVMHASSSSALDFLRSGIGGRGFNSGFMAQTSMESSNLIFAPFQEYKPNSLSFPVDDVTRYGNPSLPDQQNMNGSSLMFALGANKRNGSNTTTSDDQDKGQENSNGGGFWNGMLGGGPAW